MAEANKRGFASDNNSGIHPALLRAIEEANTGHVTGYGDDEYTRRAEAIVRSHFGNRCEVFFVLTGTGANVLSLAASTRSYSAVLCAATSHIQVDECGAPEKFTQCKLIPVPTGNGKITCGQLEEHMHGVGFEHHVQPRVISISQPTEMGTVYTVEEIRALSAFAKDHNLLMHMDGARLANAAVSLQLPFYAFTADAGVDILSFGGTKNGMLFGESVVLFNPALTEGFRYFRKQAMQLSSKMRFISVQFEVYLRDAIWESNAKHANRMARLLLERVSRIDGVEITQPVEANAVFAVIPREVIFPLQQVYFFYVWDEGKNEVRWMTSFDTTEDDIEGFAITLEKFMGST